ncbi:MAG TPA: ABC transporter permease [Fimbriimonadaceae bacterium]
MKLGLREWLALTFVVLVCLFAGLKDPRFFGPKSIDSILLWLPLITVVAMGEMLVIVTREIDISVGSMLGFTGIAVGLMFKANPHLSVPVAILAGLGVGLLLGFVNGALVTWGKISSLIVTIGTLAGFRGLSFLVSKGDEIDSSMVPDSLTSLSTKGIHVGHVTISVLLIIALVVAVITALFLRFARLGRDIYAMGNNPQAAYLRGISPNKITMFVFCVAGALGGLAGVMYAARFGFVNPGSAGQGFELTVIAAVAIGGVKLMGGSGSVFGVLMGCLLLSCINVALSVLGIDANWQLLAYGLVILAAILLDAMATKWHTRKAAA